MALLSVATIWLLWSAFLLFPHLGLPRYLSRAAMTLLCAELVALLAVYYAVPGSSVAWVADGLTHEIPALSAGLIAVAVWLLARAHRAAAPKAAAGAETVTTRSRSRR